MFICAQLFPLSVQVGRTCENLDDFGGDFGDDFGDKFLGLFFHNLDTFQSYINSASISNFDLLFFRETLNMEPVD